MKLCPRCTRVGRHEAGCPEDPYAGADDSMRALADASASLSDAEAYVGGEPASGIRLGWLAEQALERVPSDDLRRAQLAGRAQAVADRAVSAVGPEEASRLFEDMAFAREALERFAEVARRRHEALAFDLSEFVEMPPRDRREAGEAYNELCEEIEKALFASDALEEEVASWGNGNVLALAHGKDPVVPASKLPAVRGVGVFFVGMLLLLCGLGGAGAAYQGMLPKSIVVAGVELAPYVLHAGGGLAALGLLMALVGFVRWGESARARREAPGSQKERFHKLSNDYRQRIYMTAAFEVLRPKAAFVDKAEQAFRDFTGGKSAERWKRLCSEKDALRTFFEWDVRMPIREAVMRAVSAAIGPKGRLRPFDEMAPDAWEVLVKAFLLDRQPGNKGKFFPPLAGLVEEGGMPLDQLEKLAHRVVEAWKKVS